MNKQEFADYLFFAGLERKTVKTYVNAAANLLERNPEEPWKALASKKLTKQTKNVYLSALKRWADFTENEELLEILQSRRVRKLVTVKGGLPPKRVTGMSAENVDLIMAQIVTWEQENVIESHIRYAVELMIRLLLRAQADLAWISREAVEEAVRNRTVLTLVSKGSKERDVPVGHTLEALDYLNLSSDWDTIGDLLSPGSKNPQEAAYERVRRLLKAAAKEVGLDPSQIHTHRFRHASASWVYQETRDMALIQQLLGHESIRTTEIYLGLDLARERGAILSRRFGG